MSPRCDKHDSVMMPRYDIHPDGRIQPTGEYRCLRCEPRTLRDCVSSELVLLGPGVAQEHAEDDDE